MVYLGLRTSNDLWPYLAPPEGLLRIIFDFA